MDESTSVTSLLRKCIILGGRASSSELRDWARKELRGYNHDEPIPDYRHVRGMIAIDGLLPFGGQIHNQQISSHDLPDVVRDHINEQVPLHDGLGDIEQLANAEEDHLKLALPGSAEIIKLMHAKRSDPHAGQITRIYWAVSRASINGVIEQVRTSLAELIAEIAAFLPDHDADPDKTTVDHAVGLIVTGKRNNVRLVNSQSSNSSTSQVGDFDSESEDTPWWTRWRKRGLIIGAATIAAAIATVSTWLGWTPW